MSCDNIFPWQNLTENFVLKFVATTGVGQEGFFYVNQIQLFPMECFVGESIYDNKGQLLLMNYIHLSFQYKSLIHCALSLIVIIFIKQFIW